MCRLLVVRARSSFDPGYHLEKFAHISKNSAEYQGHGWGCAYMDERVGWEVYKNINPVWEDDFDRFPPTTLLVAHARSAFDDRGIAVENNMPFYDQQQVFIFNGELRGVRIREQGRIGAEKIFNYIKRFDRGDTFAALQKAVGIIKKRTRHIIGMNIIMVHDERIYLSTLFNKNKEYFTMHFKDASQLIICSEPYPLEDGWQDLANGSMRMW